MQTLRDKAAEILKDWSSDRAFLKKRIIAHLNYQNLLLNDLDEMQKKINKLHAESKKLKDGLSQLEFVLMHCHDLDEMHDVIRDIKELLRLNEKGEIVE